MDFFDSKECEWADIEVFIEGARTMKFTGIKWKPTKEKEFLYAGGSNPASIQSGNRGLTGTLTLLKGAVDNMNDAAVAQGGEDLLDLEFIVVINFVPKGQRKRRTHTISSLQVSEYEEGMMQNDKKSEIALPFLALAKKTVTV